MLYFQRIFCSFACPLKLEEGACKKEKYHINKSVELINLQVWRSFRKGHQDRWCHWDICIRWTFRRHLHPCKDNPSKVRRHRKLPFAIPSCICRSGYHFFPCIYHWHKPDLKRRFVLTKYLGDYSKGWPYSQTGSSQRCPVHLSSHSQVLGWVPHFPFLHPGRAKQLVQFSPLQPS